MDRLNRSVTYLGLGLLLTAAGCRSTQSEVPPTKQSLFSRLGQQQEQKTQNPPESTVNFNQEPRQPISPPYGGYTPNASGMGMNQQPGLNPNQPGMSGPGGLPMSPPGGGNPGLMSDPGANPAGGGLGANSGLGGGTNAGSFGSTDPGFGSNGGLGGGATQPSSRWGNQPGALGAGSGVNPASSVGGATGLPASNPNPNSNPLGVLPGGDSQPSLPVINQNPAVNPAAPNR